MVKSSNPANSNAISLLRDGHPHHALPLLTQIAKREPTYGNLLNRAAAERACCIFEAAEETLLKCIGMDPLKAFGAYNNMAQLYTDTGRFEHAPLLFAEAAKICDAAGNAVSLRKIMLGWSQSLMRLGYFENAWPAWESGRLAVSWNTAPGTKVWRGEHGNVLIVLEGGYGDAFNFIRWIAAAKKLAKSLTLIIWDCLVDWYDWKAIGIDAVIPVTREFQTAAFDFTASWMSLPGICEMKTWGDIPPAIPVPSGQQGSDLGFCWKAEENGQIRKTRTLDKKTAASVSKYIGPHVELVPREDWLRTWEDTSGVISGLHGVITVDTAVAHLAGVLQIPTLCLVPYRSDWKWGMPDDIAVSGSRWYPNMTIFRNPDPARWNSPDVIEAIDKWQKTL